MELFEVMSLMCETNKQETTVVITLGKIGQFIRTAYEDLAFFAKKICGS
jgi:hypothetical protein